MLFITCIFQGFFFNGVDVFLVQFNIDSSHGPVVGDAVTVDVSLLLLLLLLTVVQ